MHIVTRNADADLSGRRFDCLIASYNYLGQLQDRCWPAPHCSAVRACERQRCPGQACRHAVRGNCGALHRSDARCVLVGSPDRA